MRVKKMKILLLGALLLFGVGTKGFTTKQYSTEFDHIFKKYAQNYSLDWQLLKAIATVESGLNPHAINYSDPSYGLMQILYPNTLNVENWPPASASELLDPDYNVSIGAQILSWNIKTYGYQRGIAVYNSWSSRLSPEFGPFPNEAYVNKVTTELRKLRSNGNAT